MQFFQDHKLGVVRDAAGEPIRQAERGRERDDRDRVGAAERGRERRDGGAQNIHLRIASRQHAPGGLGRDECRRCRKPAGFFDPRPQFPQRAEFRDGQKLVGVRREAKEDHAVRGIERDALSFQRAQIGERGGEHERQLLRFRAAGIVNDATVGDGEFALEAVAGERRQPASKMRRFLSPRARGVGAKGQCADRIVTDANARAAMRAGKSFRQHRVEHSARLRREIEFECRAGTKIKFFEHAPDRLLACRQAETMVSGRTRKDQRQAVGAVIELTQRALVGARRVGMLDPRHDLPRRSARRARRRATRRRFVAPAARWKGHQRCLLISRSKGAPFKTWSTRLRHCASLAGGKSAASGRSSVSLMAAKCHAGRAGPISPACGIAPSFRGATASREPGIR